MPNQSATATIPELKWRRTLNLVKIPRGGGGKRLLKSKYIILSNKISIVKKTCDVFSWSLFRKSNINDLCDL